MEGAMSKFEYGEDCTDMGFSLAERAKHWDTESEVFCEPPAKLEYPTDDWANATADPNRLVWCCPECRSSRVQSQMWVRTNTGEVLDDTERYGWCDACESELSSLDELPWRECLEGAAEAATAKHG